jgi:hypothetical protein
MVLEVFETEARAGQKGFWANPQPVPPWRYRKLNRAKNCCSSLHGQLEKEEAARPKTPWSPSSQVVYILAVLTTERAGSKTNEFDLQSPSSLSANASKFHCHPSYVMGGLRQFPPACFKPYGRLEH